jgi:hypothetical protein
MSSLEDGFDGEVEDMLSGAEVNYGRKRLIITHTVITFFQGVWCEKSTALFMIYPMLLIAHNQSNRGLVT